MIIDFQGEKESFHAADNVYMDGYARTMQIKPCRKCQKIQSPSACGNTRILSCY